MSGLIAGQGTAGAASAKLLTFGAGPLTLILSNSGTSTAWLGVGGSAVTLANGFPLQTGAYTPLVIPFYQSNPGGTMYAITASGSTSIGWFMSQASGGAT